VASGTPPEQDDWFVGAVPAATEDDWVSSERPPEPRSERYTPPRRLPPRSLLLAGLGVLALVAAGVAAALIFTGGSKHPESTPPVTTPSTGSHQTTTTKTTPAGQAPTGPTVTLKPGDTGTQVKRLQRVLRLFGYSTDKVDGVYGPATESAVRRFQQASNLTADGIVGPKTLQALKHAVGAR
jgi:hypothetical protein